MDRNSGQLIFPHSSAGRDLNNNRKNNCRQEDADNQRDFPPKLAFDSDTAVTAFPLLGRGHLAAFLTYTARRGGVPVAIRADAIRNLTGTEWAGTWHSYAAEG